MTEKGKIKQIAWTECNGDLYGVAHGLNGDPLGNVRIEYEDSEFYITAYSFRGNWKVSTSFISEGLKEKAESELIELLEAA